MSADDDRLIDDFLDDRLSGGQVDELNRRINTDPQFAREFAEALYLHDRLFDMARSGRASERGKPEISGSQLRSYRKPVTRRIRVWGMLAAAVAFLVFSTLWNSTRTLNAATEIDRLIAKIDTSPDRRYEIRNLDQDPDSKPDRQPPIDGASLYVRNPDRYMLERRYPDGRRFLTGSDGQTSWAIAPDGPVRVSPDPERFRGPVPGHQHGLPFVDVRGDLNRFRSSYDLSGPNSTDDGLRKITGTRKPGVPRGPRSFEMTYDPASGSIRRMIFDGLPQARGGPRRVAVDLIDSKPLPDDFFVHQSHHTSDREVIEEL
ncbi:hypothetical protein GC170_01635 [bacterium]|nr:hypothetical protein [bacterium]